MTRHFLLAVWIGSMLAGSAMAQSASPHKPAPLPIEITPEIFPSVTPLPPKPPVPEPTPEPSLEPSAQPSSEPSPQPSMSPRPTPRPTGKPTPAPTPQPTVSPQGKAQLVFSLPKLTEGQRVWLQLELKGPVNYPVRGWIRYQDRSYDYSKTLQESVPFELTGPGPKSFAVIFRSPGRKQIKIETPAAPARNVLAFVQPFTATVFPVNNTQTLQQDPDLWHVWVNLHHSLSAQHPQRQYYLVTYNGEIVQKLLTSSAQPGKLTPEGKFVLGAKIASPTSTLYDSVMPFWTTILIPGHSLEYGNHGLTGEAYLYNLGVPASHGCLRLSNKWVQQAGQWLNIGGAKWVYSHVPVGTRITIFRQPVQPFAFQNYSMWAARQR